MDFLVSDNTDLKQIQRILALRVRELRLHMGWKQSTLAARSGVTLSSLRRFERTGLISLASFLQLVHALGRLGEFSGLLEPPAARSIADLQRMANPASPKRGSR